MTGSRSKTVRLVEIAELLGVTKQRAHQIAQEKSSPAPLAEGHPRLEVQAWAKRWRREKPWRGFRSSISDGEYLANDGRRHDDQSYAAESVTE